MSHEIRSAQLIVINILQAAMGTVSDNPATAAEAGVRRSMTRTALDPSRKI